MYAQEHPTTEVHGLQILDFLGHFLLEIRLMGSLVAHLPVELRGQDDKTVVVEEGEGRHHVLQRMEQGSNRRCLPIRGCCIDRASSDVEALW